VTHGGDDARPVAETEALSTEPLSDAVTLSGAGPEWGSTTLAGAALAGTVLAERYVIDIAVGRGGSGTVYRAYDLVTRGLVGHQGGGSVPVE
jgi:hypothetical protein